MRDLLHDSLTRVRYSLREIRENGASHRLFSRDRPVLEPAQADVARSLGKWGIAVTRLTDLIPDPPLWEGLQAAAFAYRDSDYVRRETAAVTSNPQSRHKGFIVRKYPYGAHPRVPLTDPWLRAGLDSRLLSVVNEYFEMWSKLHYFDIWLTIPHTGVQERTASQNWHRDPEDERICKVFLYFSDVDEQSGALQYVPGSRRSGGPYAHLWRRRSEGYPPSEELERQIPPSEWVTAAGPAGTLVLVDTSGFHRGGYVTGEARLSATWTFRTPAGLEPRRFDVDWSAGPDDLSPAARYALL